MTTTKPKPRAELQIVYRDPNGLKVYGRNSRTHTEAQIEKLRASFREFGFTNPVLLKDDGVTIGAGHARTRAAIAERLEKIPTITLVGLTDKQWRAYVIADNQLAITGSGWDMGLLESEMAALAGDDFDISLLGFDDDPFGIEKPEEAGKVNLVDTSTVADIFWISVSGKLALQADALDRLKTLMADLPGVTVELGTVKRDG